MEEELLYGSQKGNDPSIFLGLEAEAPFLDLLFLHGTLRYLFTESETSLQSSSSPTIPVPLILPPTHGLALVLFLHSLCFSLV